MKYHEYVLLSAMESCPRGRRSMIGNHVGGKHCLKGSNPLLSVSYLQTGPLVKRLRHRPFTEQAGGQRFDPVNLHYSVGSVV